MTGCLYFIFFSLIFYGYIFFYRNAVSFSTYVDIVFFVLLIKNAFKYVLKPNCINCYEFNCTLRKLLTLKFIV